MVSISKDRVISRFQANKFDTQIPDTFGIPVLLLMENAGKAVAQEAEKIAAHKVGKIAIFCGKGNNGGDGFVAARQLLCRGIKPEIFLAGSMGEVRNEAGVNLHILSKLKIKITEVREETLSIAEKKILKFEVIVDALLGIGLKGEVRGVYRNLIDLINASHARVLSVDIPSGLDADTGKVLGCCVKADTTVTFLAKKRGMVVGEGPEYCGRIIVEGLGIPF